MAISVRFPEELEQRLTQLAQETHRTKSFYIQQAVKQFLEDREDYFLAAAAWEKHQRTGRKTISLEEIEKKYNLDD